MKIEERKNAQGEGSQGLSMGKKHAGRVLIKKLNDNDVLQGRGSGSMQNTGNIKFRNLVEKLRPAYVATSSRKEKARMISDMVRLIQSRNGRFLQRLCDNEVDELGLDFESGEHGHYVEMTNEEAAEKAKQAIRYVHYKKVPLEEERRKKREADDDKAYSEAANGTGFGANSLVSAPFAARMTNQVTQSQVPKSNLTATFNPQVQQSDIGHLLTSFQTAQTTLAAAQLSGNGLNAVQAAVRQPSLFRDHANGIIPLGYVQQQPNILQRLSSSFTPDSNGALPKKVGQVALLDSTGNHNANQAQLPKQQAQLNGLLQNILQQQANLQQNTILQTLLQQQQQQEQKQLNSALQTLQQQQQLASAIHTLQQPQQLQQHKTNSILASLLSNANGNTSAPMGSTMNPLTGHAVPNINSTATGMGNTNALLASYLSNNATPAAAFQQTTSPLTHGTGKASNHMLGGFLPSINTLNVPNTIQQQNQGLAGGSAIQAIPGLAQNVNSLLAANGDKSSMRHSTVTNANDTKKAKRPRHC